MTKQELKEVIEKIIRHIKNCRLQGFEDNTIVEHFNNPYILEEIILKERDN